MFGILAPNIFLKFDLIYQMLRQSRQRIAHSLTIAIKSELILKNRIEILKLFNVRQKFSSNLKKKIFDVPFDGSKILTRQKIWKNKFWIIQLELQDLF